MGTWLVAWAVMCVGASVVRAQPTESQGGSLWGKGQDRFGVRVGTGHLCRDKENIRQSWARLCSSSAGRCAGGGSELIPGLSHPNPCFAQMGQSIWR